MYRKLCAVENKIQPRQSILGAHFHEISIRCNTRRPFFLPRLSDSGGRNGFSMAPWSTHRCGEYSCKTEPRGHPRGRWSAMVDREHFDYYAYRPRHNALVAAAQPMRRVHCKHRLATLYDRRRCEVKCAWLRSAMVHGICTSISMSRSSIRSWGPRPEVGPFVRTACRRGSAYRIPSIRGYDCEEDQSARPLHVTPSRCRV